MYFLNYSFFSNKHSMDSTNINSVDFEQISVSNGIFDDVFVGKNVNMNPKDLKWDYDTIFWAAFKNVLSAGNVAEKLSEITSAIVKRRKIGSNAWIPIYEVPINSQEDVQFETFDRFPASGIKYQYAIVFLLNDEEGSYNISEITPEFKGVFIVDQNNIFNSVMEVQVDTQRNHKKAVIETIDMRYPFVVNQSKNNYDSGSVSAVFAKWSEDECDFDFDGSYEYRSGLKDFLASGSAKFLKVDDGRIWMMVVTDPISDTQEIDTNKITTSFGWVEIGDVENVNDLAKNGFIDSGRI